MILKRLSRDACRECRWYHAENRTCQMKKCSGWGAGYVAWSDRFCKAGRKKEAQE